MDQRTVCVGETVRFTGSSDISGAKYQWDFNGGFADDQSIQRPKVIFNNPGVYDVRLTACKESNCASTEEQQYITVLANPTANFEANPDVCDPYKIQFTDASLEGSMALTDWLWDFGDGQYAYSNNPTHIFPKSGLYTVILFVTDEHGCSSAITKEIAIRDRMNAELSIAQSVSCNEALSTSLLLTTEHGNGPFSMEWNFGNNTSALGNPVNVEYQTCGQYHVAVNVTDANGCLFTFDSSALAEVFCPEQEIKVRDFCQNKATNFSIESATDIQQSRWYFNNPAPSPTSNSRNASHTYTSPGNYNVRFEGSYSNGCVIDSEVVIEILEQPKIGVTTINPIATSCAPLEVTMESAEANGVAPFTYRWRTNGTNYNEQEAVHTFTSVGRYPVNLRVTDINGCSKDSTISIVEVDAMKLSFEMAPDKGCVPLSTTAIDLVAKSKFPITNYTWDFGDGRVVNTNTNVPPNHTYTEVGRFEVTLTVTTQDGCVESYSDSVLVGDEIAYFDFADFDSICPPIVLIDLPLLADSIEIDWGDGTTDFQTKPFNQFEHSPGYNLNPGWTVRMTAWHNGCESTYERIIRTKRPIGGVSRIFPDCNNPNNVTLTLNSADVEALQNGCGWCWDVGNGPEFCNERTINHTFPNGGRHLVHVIDACTLNGSSNPEVCAGSGGYIVDVIDVDGAIKLGTTATCVGSEVRLDHSIVDLFDNTFNISWKVGPGINTNTDSLVSNKKKVSFIPTNADTYPVSLTVRDRNGCFHYLTDTFTTQRVVADFGFDAIIGCNPKEVDFKNLSFADGPIADEQSTLQYQWLFGNDVCPSSSERIPPNCTYTSGNYTITLEVTDELGCTDKTDSTIFVGDLSAKFPADTQICMHEPIVFNAISTGPIKSYTWDFGDGNSSSEKDATHHYRSSGVYRVTLTGVDEQDCATSYSDLTVIEIDELEAKIEFNSLLNTFCPPIPLQYIDASSGAVSARNWNIQSISGFIETEDDSIIVTYAEPGYYTAELAVASPLGCKDTIKQVVPLQVNTLDGEMTIVQTEGCTPSPIQFILSELNADLAFIDFGDGDTSRVYRDTIHVYDTGSTYCPTLVLLDTLSGCSNIIGCHQEITIATTPQPAFNLNTAQPCIGDKIIITNESIIPEDNFVQFLDIDFGNGEGKTIRPSFTQTRYEYEDTGRYTITMRALDVNGCLDSAVAEVVINPIPSASLAISGTVGCPPLNVSFDFTDVHADSIWLDFGNGEAGYVYGDTVYTYRTRGNYKPSGYMAIGQCVEPLDIASTIEVTQFESVFSLDQHIGCDEMVIRGSNHSKNTLPDITYKWLVGPSAKEDWVDSIIVTDVSDVTFRLSEPDLYPIQLVATDNEGCLATYYDTVIVGGVNSFFVADSIVGCAPKIVHFSSQVDPIIADYTAQEIVAWHWSFGKNACEDYFSNLPPACELPPGKHQISLEVEDNLGCSSIYDTLITVQNASVLIDSVATLCTGDIVTFSSSLAGEFDSYHWIIDQRDTLSNQLEIEYVFDVDQMHYVTFEALDQDQCLHEIRDSIEINFDLPTAVINPAQSEGCLPLMAQLNGSESKATVDWNWLVETPEGVESFFTETIAYQFLDTGYFDARLIVTSTTGCLDTAILPNAVYVTTPTAAIAIDQPNSCLPAIYTVDILNPDSNQLWVTIPSIDTFEIYTDTALELPNAGEYCIGMTIEDVQYGCVKQIPCEKVLTFFNAPKADFLIEDSTPCVGQLFRIEDHSILDGQLVQRSVAIDFGDGRDTLIPQFEQIEIRYTDPGFYPIQLKVTDSEGCIDSIAQTIEIFEIPELTNPIIGDTGCVPLFAEFNLEHTADSLFLDFGTGTYAFINDSVASYLYSTAGAYQPSIRLFNTSGCSDSFLDATTILVAEPSSGLVEVKEDLLCVGQPVELSVELHSGFSNPILNYALFINDTLLDTFDRNINQHSITTLAGGLNQINLQIIDALGCSSTMDSIQLEMISQLGLTVFGDTAVCPGTIVSIGGDIAESRVNVAYSWLNSNAYDFDVSDFNHALEVLQTDSLCMIATCGAVFESRCIELMAYETPDIEVIEDTVKVIEPDLAVINAVIVDSATAPISYQWLNEVECDTCLSLSVLPKEPTWYTAMVEDANGCIDIDSVLVYPISDCVGKSMEVGLAFTPNGDGKNDAFLIRSPSIAQMNFFTIYNRWGEKVFETNELHNGWDGTFNGAPSNPAVYMWFASGVCINNETFTRKGDVTLIR